MTGIRASVGCG